MTFGVRDRGARASQLRLDDDSLRAALAQAERPLAADDLARAFKGGKKRGERVSELLESLSLLGQVREDKGRYFLVDRG